MRIPIREKWFYIAIILLLGLSYAVLSNASSSKFAAKVNGTPIEYLTLDAAVNNFIENQKVFGVELKEEDRAKLRRDILEELISAELLYQESKRVGLKGLDKEVEQQFESIKQGFSSGEEFKKVLRERNIAEKQLKEDVRKGVYIKAFLDTQLYNKIAIGEEEKRTEYEKNKDRLKVSDQIRARHILVRVEEDAASKDKEEARTKIEQVRQLALQGEDFEELAKKFSEDGSASRGGDLGYFGKGQMVKPFEDAAFSLKEGEISDVVETQFGYHIIKLEDDMPAHDLAYEEVEPVIERFLVDQKKQEVLDGFVKELKESAKIERYID